MTAISKNVYFDVLDDIVDKYNNTVHRAIKTKPIEVTSEYNIMKFLMKKILNLKLVILSEYQNIKIFLLKDIFKIGQKRFIAKLKIQFRGLMLLVT